MVKPAASWQLICKQLRNHQQAAQNWRWSSYAATGIAFKLRQKQLWKNRKSAVYFSSRTFNLTVTFGLRSRGFDDIKKCSRWFPFTPIYSFRFISEIK
jgi:hypothetical protein